MLHFLSDTHFNHANIIKYSNRPFKNVEEMNRVLVENWVDSVEPDDVVIFAGDFAMKRWESLFKAVSKCNIIFIRGNHDRDFHPPQGLRSNILVNGEGGIQIYITHAPENIPADYKGWVIHGHHHNNWPDDFPFFNPVKKTINVSVDVIGYRPISEKDIMNLIQTQKEPIATRD
jgi:calcineurin-like phosphoesterase family protein